MIFLYKARKNILKFKLTTHFSFFFNGGINIDFWSLSFLWDFPVQSVSGLQIRGGKGNFFIDCFGIQH